MNTLPTNLGDLRLSDLLKIQGVTVIVNVTAEATPPPVIMPPPEGDRFLSRDDVVKKTSLSREKLRLMNLDGTFPKPIKISGKRVAWRESDVQRWMDSR